MRPTQPIAAHTARAARVVRERSVPDPPEAALLARWAELLHRRIDILGTGHLVGLDRTLDRPQADEQLLGAVDALERKAAVETVDLQLHQALHAARHQVVRHF